MQKDNYDNELKILIVRLSSIGDIILTTEFIRVARSKFPKSKIYYLTSKPFAELVKYNSNIDHLILYDKSKSKKDLLKERDRFLLDNKFDKFDIIFDLQFNRRSKKWCKGVSKEYYHIQKWLSKKLRLIYTKNLDIEIPKIPLNYLNVAKEYEFKSDGKGLELYTGIECKNNKEKIVGIAPGAHHFTKRYPIERFSEAIKKIANLDHNLTFQIFGSNQDSNLAKKIIQENLELNIIDYTGKLTLLETAAKIQNCKCFISNDTGLMHIASAFKVPIVGIFGSTVKNFGFTPYGTDFRIVESKEKLNCRPCTHIGKSSCPKKHFKCMNKIEPEDIVIAYKQLLRTS